MKPGAERVGSWRRIRSVLIVVGDVIGVLVLIGVIAILGSHGFHSEVFLG